MKTFEDYLKDIHGKQYIGIDDCMPEDFNDWLESQDIQDIITYAERFRSYIVEKILKFIEEADVDLNERLNLIDEIKLEFLK